jgi:hypothetical protein
MYVMLLIFLFFNICTKKEQEKIKIKRRTNQKETKEEGPNVINAFFLFKDNFVASW